MAGRDRYVNEITVTTDYEVPINMDYVYADATAGNVTITLKRTKDRLIRRHGVKKTDVGANTVTVTDGTLSYVLATQNDAAIFEIDGTGLFSVYGATSGSGATPPSFTIETPTGDVDGVNDEFTFTAPPISIYRNGVMERRLGTTLGNVFTFNTPPDLGDDIEGMV